MSSDFDITNVLDRASDLPVGKLPDVCARAARVIRNLREVVIAYKQGGWRKDIKPADDTDWAMLSATDAKFWVVSPDSPATLPQPTLTDSERQVIEAILVDPDSAPANSAAILRGLLERLR